MHLSSKGLGRIASTRPLCLWQDVVHDAVSVLRTRLEQSGTYEFIDDAKHRFFSTPDFFSARKSVGGYRRLTPRETARSQTRLSVR
jgi:hypothetical protein